MENAYSKISELYFGHICYLEFNICETMVMGFQNVACDKSSTCTMYLKNKYASSCKVKHNCYAISCNCICHLNMVGLTVIKQDCTKLTFIAWVSMF